MNSITVFMLKSAKSEIAEVPCFVFNLGIITHTFTDLWKSANVTPFANRGSRSDAGNNRPILVLPSSGNLLDFIFQSQRIEYLELYKSLLDSEFGSRSNRSMGLCLVDF